MPSILDINGNERECSFLRENESECSVHSLTCLQNCLGCLQNERVPIAEFHIINEMMILLHIFMRIIRGYGSFCV